MDFSQNKPQLKSLEKVNLVVLILETFILVLMGNEIEIEKKKCEEP